MMQHRETAELDPAGRQTLELFAGKDYFNKWLFDALHPYMRDSILEIGGGIGNISAFLLAHYSKVTLSDLRPEYIERLKKRFSHEKGLRRIMTLDLSVTDMEQRYPELMGHFDTVIASNVIEHIADDRLAIQNCYKMLKKGGRLIVLVPAYQCLYNRLDIELGHFRRYSKKSLARELRTAGFAILHRSYFNTLGIPGWWLNGWLLKKRLIPKNQLDIFNRLVPVIKLLDKLVFQRMGLSVIAVGEK